MKINSIQLNNFKNFNEGQSFEFKDNNILKGNNGSGKTAIKEAIIFCLYGKTLTGGRDTDRYIQKGKLSTQVILNTDIGTFERTRDSKGSQFTGSEEKLPNFEEFSLVFNVGYFASLSERHQKELFFRYLTTEDHKKAFDKLHGEQEWLDEFNLDLQDLDKTTKKVRRLKREFKKEQDRYQMLKEYWQNPPKSFPDLKGAEKFRQKEIKRTEQESHDCSVALNKIHKLYKIFSPDGIQAVELREQLRPLIEDLQKFWDDVEIVTQTEYKTKAAYKEVFKFIVDGITYSNLSAGEKKRFDLAVSQFFNKRMKQPLNMFFVDEETVLDEYIDVPTQSFTTRLSPSDKLTIT